MLAKAALMIALASLPGWCEGPVFDIYNQARTSSQHQFFDAGPAIHVLTVYDQYIEAGETKTAGHLRSRFIHSLRALSRIKDPSEEVNIIGQLIYFAAGLSDRGKAIDLLADILAYCPAAASMHFIYTAPNGQAAGRTGDIYTALSAGVYLGFPPRPFDENPQLATRKFEIAAWDGESLENLKFSVESRRAQAKI